MAEFCLKCFNEHLGGCGKDEYIVLSKEPEFCEGCCQVLPVVIGIREIDHCFGCDCWDSDREGCTMPSIHKGYACSKYATEDDEYDEADNDMSYDSNYDDCLPCGCCACCGCSCNDRDEVYDEEDD